VKRKVKDPEKPKNYKENNKYCYPERFFPGKKEN